MSHMLQRMSQIVPLAAAITSTIGELRYLQMQARKCISARPSWERVWLRLPKRRSGTCAAAAAGTVGKSCTHTLRSLLAELCRSTWSMSRNREGRTSPLLLLLARPRPLAAAAAAADAAAEPSKPSSLDATGELAARSELCLLPLSPPRTP